MRRGRETDILKTVLRGNSVVFAEYEGKMDVFRQIKACRPPVCNRFIIPLTSVAVSILSVLSSYGGMNDGVLCFSTPGPDRYADGSPVADGECYALVWSPSGSSFSGFNADGSPVSSRDRVVLAAPLAQGGRCRDSVFQVPAKEYEALKNGEWAVCLVDTRTAEGTPAGVKDNVPLRVNRWGGVDGSVTVSSADKLEPSAAAPAKGGRLLAAAAPSKAGVCAGTLSAVPDSVKPPTITGLEVLDSGEVWLEVADTVPFLSYTIISGSEPGNLQDDSCAEVVDGTSGGKIFIGTAQSSDCRFFKVTRAE